MSYLSEKEFQQVSEYLDQKLGREATDAEIEAYIKELEDRNFETIESEAKGK